MKQFGRLTSRQKETQLLVRFVCVCCWMAMMPPTPSFPVPSIGIIILVGLLSAGYQRCLTWHHTLSSSLHVILCRQSIAPYWRRLRYNELCTLCPDTSVCFAYLPFLSNYSWIHSRYLKAYLFLSQVYLKVWKVAGAKHTVETFSLCDREAGGVYSLGDYSYTYYISSLCSINDNMWIFLIFDILSLSFFYQQ